MSKHTKGRWVVGKSVDDPRNFAINIVDEEADNDNEHIWTEMATVYRPEGGNEINEALHNARLIAASPTLLQAIVDAEKELSEVIPGLYNNSRKWRIEALRTNLSDILKTLDHE